VTVVYWTLLASTSLTIGGFATALGALYTTVRDIFRTLPQTWVDEMLTDEDVLDAAHELERNHDA
jgi:hypothetical protein